MSTTSALPPTQVGDVYERLTVIELRGVRTTSTGARVNFALVQCSCTDKTVREVRLSNLRSGRTRSCGCLGREKTTTHGQHASRLYGIWAGMRHRCSSPNIRAAHRYTGRGITVCDAWNDFATFRAWALAHGYADGKEIDRRDNNLGYSPDNCRWVTRLENLANRAKHLPEDLEQWLRAEADRQNCSPYEVIKQALEQYLGVSRTGCPAPPA
ncbi:HNH endonuclease [Streptomyces sp. NBC_01474]|uniref:hypothetical protein n=1 Tax=Streptomyces sp. NBC_01474 TaxID=2903880 RepID=UPI002DDA8D42|nr:hypothetical protein [Streptomyces sp. NBC_01474]WSD92765.1 HNH endonuclease [Streptomyces sp. NBC_01474]WSE01290.1 HNH endonuclease [Streptomyces sp. NBC_01474]